MQPQFVSPGLAPTNGTWLGGPQSSLSGIYNGQQKTVLLTLSKCAPSHPRAPSFLWHAACRPLTPAC